MILAQDHAKRSSKVFVDGGICLTERSGTESVLLLLLQFPAGCDLPVDQCYQSTKIIDVSSTTVGV